MARFVATQIHAIMPMDPVSICAGVSYSLRALCRNDVDSVVLSHGGSQNGADRASMVPSTLPPRYLDSSTSTWMLLGPKPLFRTAERSFTFEFHPLSIGEGR